MGLLNGQTQQEYYDSDSFGGYQFTSLNHIINNFQLIYVGEGKIIPKIRRIDIAFHGQRAIQELSFDTFKSIKSQEITLPPSNTMVLPQDYVNYTKICWTDGSGIERPLYPTKHTSNPTPIFQNSDGEYKISTEASVDGSATFTLTDLFPNIRIGTVVTSTQLGVTAFVDTISNTATNTTITLVDINGNAVDTILSAGSYQGYIILDFSNPDGSIFLETESTYVAETVTFFSTIPEIVFNSSSIPSELVVGMEVIHPDFPSGTIIENLEQNSSTQVLILTSIPPTANSTLTTNEVTFILTPGDSSTWNSYKSNNSNNTSDANAYNYDTDIYDLNIGQRFGLDPSHAQGNGSFYIDDLKGLIHFSSNFAGKNIVLKYISDGLGTDSEMVVHKFAEEAMYKSIAYAILSTSISGQVLVPRFKKEKFAAIRQAKLRLSNLKIDELTQIMRGKSKWIKH